MPTDSAALADRIRGEIETYRYAPPTGLLGNPVPRERIARGLEELRRALVEPRRDLVEGAAPGSPEPAGCWIVAEAEGGWTRLFYHEESEEFGLAWKLSDGRWKSIEVRGDLVGTFLAL